jgi:hypothetical protein
MIDSMVLDSLLQKDNGAERSRRQVKCCQWVLERPKAQALHAFRLVLFKAAAFTDVLFQLTHALAAGGCRQPLWT